MSEEIVIAVVGSRTFTDRHRLYVALDGLTQDYRKDNVLIISGGARGADSLAEDWANESGVEIQVFEAEWDLYGKRAGMIRNSKIIALADIVLAFWDGTSKGTLDSINKARSAGKRVLIEYF